MWLSMVKDFWRRRQEQNGVPGLIIEKFRNFRDLFVNHNCNCKETVLQESVADLIRGKLYRKSTSARPPSTCCLTLYMQRCKERTYGMFLKTCPSNLDKEILHALWTTCLFKINQMAAET